MSYTDRMTMSIRLRTVDGHRVALCAARCEIAEGDVYLDDADHYALAIKFRRDYQSLHEEPETTIMTAEECEHLAAVHPDQAIAVDGSLICFCKTHRA